MAILTSSLFENVLAQVTDYDSSIAIWTVLQDTFAARSSAHVMQTRLQLVTLKKGFETISEYYNKARARFSTLLVAG